MDFFYLLNKKIIKRHKINPILIFLLVFLCLGLPASTKTANADQISICVAIASQEFGISQDLIYKIIEAESDFDPNAVSRVDARGLMQITRRTWNWICNDYLHVDWDFDTYSFDPDKNIQVGTRFLKWISDYLDNYKADLNDTKHNLVLACYNAGPGAVRNYDFQIPPYPETRNYVKKINDL